MSQPSNALTQVGLTFLLLLFFHEAEDNKCNVFSSFDGIFTRRPQWARQRRWGVWR